MAIEYLEYTLLHSLQFHLTLETYHSYHFKSVGQIILTY